VRMRLWIHTSLGSENYLGRKIEHCVRFHPTLRYVTLFQELNDFIDNSHIRRERTLDLTIGKGDYPHLNHLSTQMNIPALMKGKREKRAAMKGRESHNAEKDQSSPERKRARVEAPKDVLRETQFRLRSQLEGERVFAGARGVEAITHIWGSTGPSVALIIQRKNSKLKVFDWAKHSGDENVIQWAAFFTDCVHVIKRYCF